MANLANGKLADLTKLLQSSKLNRVAGAYRLNRVQACFYHAHRNNKNTLFAFMALKAITLFRENAMYVLVCTGIIEFFEHSYLACVVFCSTRL